MKDADFLREFEEILEADAGSLVPEAKLADLEGWNSLAVLSFIAMVDEHAGLTLNARAILGCRTVRELMGLLGPALVPT